MILILVLRFYLARQNTLREKEGPDTTGDDDVYIEKDGEKVKVDKVRFISPDSSISFHQISVTHPDTSQLPHLLSILLTICSSSNRLSWILPIFKTGSSVTFCDDPWSILRPFLLRSTFKPSCPPNKYRPVLPSPSSPLFLSTKSELSTSISRSHHELWSPEVSVIVKIAHCCRVRYPVSVLLPLCILFIYCILGLLVFGRWGLRIVDT